MPRMFARRLLRMIYGPVNDIGTGEQDTAVSCSVVR